MTTAAHSKVCKAISPCRRKTFSALPPDDSYCLYAENNGEIEYCLSVFLTDWAWNARAFEQNGYLCIADRREAFVYLPDTLESAASFLF